MDYHTIGNIITEYLRVNEAIDVFLMKILSRQWWGNWVTPLNNGHIWLVEAFETYSTTLWREHLGGIDQYWEWLDFYIVLDDPTCNKETVYRSPGEMVLNYVTWAKGAYILHMLRYEYGDSLFFETMRDFGQKCAYGNASTEDFQAIWEEHTNENLEWFFHQWVYEPGYPNLFWDWTNFQLSENQFEMRCCINQVHDVGPAAFKLPVTLELQFADGIERMKFFMDSSDTTFTVQTNQMPLNALLDPDIALLKKTTQVEKHFKLLDYSLEEVGGNGDASWDPGEVAHIKLNLSYEGMEAQTVGVRIEPGREHIEIVNEMISFENISDGDTLKVFDQPLEIKASGTAEAGMTKLYFHISRGGVEMQTDSIYVALGKAEILFVDDDGGKDYEQFFMNAFVQMDVFINTWDEKVRLNPPSITANDHSILIWSTGDTRENTLNHDEQQAISNYIDSGGQVIICGQNIGYDLMENGDETDSLFYTEVLCAEYISDSDNVSVLTGQPDDSVFKGALVSLQGSLGTTDPISADVIQAIFPSKGIINFGGRQDKRAGIGWSDPNGTSGVVYMTYGLEAVKGPYDTTATNLLYRCLSWLDLVTEVEQCNENTFPTDFMFYPNYPNPFNPGTKIRFDVPEVQHIKIEIFNVLGQRIHVLWDGLKQAGSHEINWNGCDASGNEASSGIYFIRFKTENRTFFRKAIKMK